MSEMKCPFCQQELETWTKYTDGTSKVWCSKCNLSGDSKLFSELIRTRKALDVAIERLNLMARETFQGEPSSINMGFHVRAEAALADINKITALEQKEQN